MDPTRLVNQIARLCSTSAPPAVEGMFTACEQVAQREVVCVEDVEAHGLPGSESTFLLYSLTFCSKSAASG